MTNKLFVGNLAWTTTSDDLQKFFSQAGNVTSATVISDKATGRSKGFGFVEYATAEEAEAAKMQLEGKDLNGRPAHISDARPQEDRPARPPRQY